MSTYLYLAALKTMSAATWHEWFGDNPDRVVCYRMWNRFMDQPRSFVGECSVAKAWSADNPEDYMPAAVSRIHTLFYNPVLVTPAILSETMVALSLPNRSVYATDRWLYDEELIGWHWSTACRKVRLGHGHRMVVIRPAGTAKHRTLKRFLLEHQQYPIVISTQ